MHEIDRTSMHLYTTFVNEWEQFFHFKEYNWTNWNYCLIRFAYENDVMLGAWELEFVLFGIGVRFRLTKPLETPEMLKMKEQVKQIDDGTATTIPWEDIQKPWMEGRCPRCYFKVDGSEVKDADNKKDK